VDATTLSYPCSRLHLSVIAMPHARIPSVQVTEISQRMTYVYQTPRFARCHKALIAGTKLSNKKIPQVKKNPPFERWRPCALERKSSWPKFQKDDKSKTPSDSSARAVHCSTRQRAACHPTRMDRRLMKGALFGQDPGLCQEWSSSFLQGLNAGVRFGVRANVAATRTLVPIHD
jgi:hypothetical protein